MTPQEMRIAVEDEVLEDLRVRLERTRLARDYANADWRVGVEGTYLGQVLDHWRDSYDWRHHEALMNRLPHFRVDIDGIPIHYVKVAGRGPAPVPIILTHGWPMTFWDYKEVVGPLSDPETFGGDAADSFDVVIPDMPGFAFSSPLTTGGLGVVGTADLWWKLMTKVLGYERFGAHGADLG